MNKLIQEVDKNGSGMIEFGEYVELAKIYIEPEEDYKQVYGELRQVFMIFDKLSENSFVTVLSKDLTNDMFSYRQRLPGVG